MEKDLQNVPAFVDIVFESRNKEYGAYVLRKKYNSSVIISLFISIILLASAVIGPFLNAKAIENRQKHIDREVQIKLENLDPANQPVTPPPVTPPPPVEAVQPAKYIPPVVVDTVKPEEEAMLMTADEAQQEVKNLDVVEVVPETRQEVVEAEPEQQPFIVVEEMPMFPGGISELLKYVADHLQYPEIAKENNIQGRVTVQFCVTPTGGVDRVSVLRGVDAELDAEAIRVVKTLPPFIPGKQGGKPVPVWFQLPINFQLK